MYITVIPGDSRIVPADDRVCYNLDATAISFRVVDLAFDCVGYPYVSSPTVMEGQISDARPLAILHCRDLGCSDIDTAEVLVGKEPGLDWEGRINSYLCMASL